MSDNIENEIEETKLPTIEETTTEVEDVEYEVEEVDGESGEEGVIGEDYSDVEKVVTYIDPTSGNVIDPDTLGPWEKIKFISTQLGQTIDEPKKNCKHCYGRGYTALDVNTKNPVACSCIYKTYFKTNPNGGDIRPKKNRKERRKYEKAVQKFYQTMAVKYAPEMEKVTKSKNNLGKNTPNFIPRALRPVEPVETIEAEVVEAAELPTIETAEGTLNG